MLAATRRGRLDESHKLQTFYRDAEEEEMWVSEKAYSLQSTDYGHDLNSAMVLLNKHEVCDTKYKFSLLKPIQSLNVGSENLLIYLFLNFSCQFFRLLNARWPNETLTQKQ